MKTAGQSLNQIIHMHFDFTTPKGLKITPTKRKMIEKEEQEKGDNRAVEKKTDIPFDFYIVYFGNIPWREKKRLSTISLTPFS